MSSNELDYIIGKLLPVDRFATPLTSTGSADCFDQIIYDVAHVATCETICLTYVCVSRLGAGWIRREFQVQDLQVRESLY